MRWLRLVATGFTGSAPYALHEADAAEEEDDTQDGSTPGLTVADFSARNAEYAVNEGSAAEERQNKADDFFAFHGISGLGTGALPGGEAELVQYGDETEAGGRVFGPREHSDGV